MPRFLLLMFLVLALRLATQPLTLMLVSLGAKALIWWCERAALVDSITDWINFLFLCAQELGVVIDQIIAWAWRHLVAE